MRQKTCKYCSLEKPITDFHPNKTYKDGFTSKCKACVYTDQKRRRAQDPAKRKIWDEKYRTENKQKVKSAQKRYYYANKDKIAERGLFFRYGLTATEYVEKLEQQNFVCAVCFQPETETLRGEIKRMSVDHDHVTGRVRDLLCNNCNWLLGHAKDSPFILRSAAQYLEKHMKESSNSVG